MEDCSSCRYSEPAVLNGIDEEEGEQVLVLKCYRYPPQLTMDSEDTMNQAWPEATHVCGEHTSAEKTSHVVGTLRKDKTWNRTLFSGLLLLSHSLWLRHASRK